MNQLQPLPDMNMRQHLLANLATPLGERVSWLDRKLRTLRHNMWLAIHNEIEPELAKKRAIECNS